jgi:hypothetical protein
MSDVVDNKTNMIRATVEYDSKPASVTATSGIPSYATVLAVVVTKLLLIDQFNIIASGTSKGVTLDTKALKKAMCFLAGKIGQALAAYASSVSNNTLYATANYTESKLMAEKKDTVDDKCEAIHAAGVANLLAAGDFGFANGDLVALLAAIGLYRTSCDDPRQAVIDKAQALKQIKLIQKDVIDNLFAKQLDKMAYTLRGTANEPFYSGHKQARVIVDLGNVTGKIFGTVQNILGQPLKGVTVTVSKAGLPQVVKVVVTKENGKFSITKLFGKYDITYEKAPATAQTETNIDVGAGKKVERTVTLINPVEGTRGVVN